MNKSPQYSTISRASMKLRKYEFIKTWKVAVTACISI